MKWPTAIVALLIAGSPLVAQQSPTADLKGQAVTLRACVKQGIANSLMLSRVSVPAPAGAASARYLFDKPAAFQDYLGGEIEIMARVRGVRAADIELTMNDGILAEIESAEQQAVGTSGTDELPPVLTMDVSKIRMLSTVCR